MDKKSNDINKEYNKLIKQKKYIKEHLNLTLYTYKTKRNKIKKMLNITQKFLILITLVLIIIKILNIANLSLLSVFSPIIIQGGFSLILNGVNIINTEAKKKKLDKKLNDINSEILRLSNIITKQNQMSEIKENKVVNNNIKNSNKNNEINKKLDEYINRLENMDSKTRNHDTKKIKVKKQ